MEKKISQGGGKGGNETRPNYEGPNKKGGGQRKNPCTGEKRRNETSPTLLTPLPFGFCAVRTDRIQKCGDAIRARASASGKRTGGKEKNICVKPEFVPRLLLVGTLSWTVPGQVGISQCGET